MEIVFKNIKSNFLEVFSLLDLDNIHETWQIFSSTKEPLEVKIFAVNELISSHQLAKLKNHFDKINVFSLTHLLKQQRYDTKRKVFKNRFSLIRGARD